jgi:hypothetical protein
MRAHAHTRLLELYISHRFGAKRIQELGLVGAGGMVTPPQMNEQTTSPRGQQCDAVEPTRLAGSNTQEGHRGVDAERYTHVAAGAGAVSS